MKGFVALLSVIIVSIILLGLALGGSTIAFFTRMDGLDRESYTQAQTLARSCGDYALLQLAQNYSYIATRQPVTLGTESCYIESVTTLTASTTQKEVQIQTSASYHNSFATFTVQAIVQNPVLATPTQQTEAIQDIVAY